MRKFITYDSFACHELEVLIEHFKSRGCVFYPCLELGDSLSPRGVSFRIDVQSRDIAGATSLLAALYRQNVPATFFLLADYSNDECRHLADFLSLAQSIQPPVDIGMHDSPVDSYLIQHKFEGNGVDYWRWLQSEKSLPWFTELAASESARDDFHRQVMDAFGIRVAHMKKTFGEFNAVASHGGEISQIFRKRIAELGATGEFMQSLFAENWITEERLAQAGLQADVEQFRKKAPLLYQVTDGGGLIQRMMQSVGTFLDRGSAVQMLLHPYTWAGPLGKSGGVRDGEISALLGSQPDKSLTDGRKWHQRLLRTRLMAIPEPNQDWKLATALPAEAVDERVIVCATVKDIDADLKRARLAAPSVRALVVDAEAGLPGQAEQPAAIPLFDYLAEANGDRPPRQVVLGQSLRKYGSLVAGAIACLVQTEAAARQEVQPSQRALAEWMLRHFNASPGSAQPGQPQLDRKELAYFFFSSSRRAEVMKRILDQFIGNQSIPCFVDHGAGIGMIPLCVQFASHSGIQRVVCSETKHSFVLAGSDLWQSLGYGGVIHYQECPATDFAYPDQVTVVLFAQMLSRVAPPKRHELIRSAWEALDAGGLLIVNEMMDRDDVANQDRVLASDELMGYLPQSGDAWLFWGGTGQDSAVNLQQADKKLFKRADNFIVFRK